MDDMHLFYPAHISASCNLRFVVQGCFDLPMSLEGQKKLLVLYPVGGEAIVEYVFLVLITRNKTCVQINGN